MIWNTNALTWLFRISWREERHVNATIEKCAENWSSLEPLGEVWVSSFGSTWKRYSMEKRSLRVTDEERRLCFDFQCEIFGRGLLALFMITSIINTTTPSTNGTRTRPARLAPVVPWWNSGAPSLVHLMSAGVKSTQVSKICFPAVRNAISKNRKGLVSLYNNLSFQSRFCLVSQCARSNCSRQRFFSWYTLGKMVRENSLHLQVVFYLAKLL